MQGPVSRDCFLILNILNILQILLQTIAIKVLTDLFSWLRLCSIDIKVFQTFFSFILLILFILAILLQTAERWRGTGPRPTGGSPAPIGQEHPILPIRERVLPNLREARLGDGYPIF